MKRPYAAPTLIPLGEFSATTMTLLRYTARTEAATVVDILRRARLLYTPRRRDAEELP